MPKPIKKKAAKKVTVETDAKSYIDSARAYYASRKKKVHLALAVIVLVALGAAGTLFYLRSITLKSSSLFSEAYVLYIDALPQNDDGKLREALDAFKKSYESKKSPLILYYEADIYERLGDFENAESSLHALMENYSADREILPLAYVKLGMLYRKKGDNEKALEAFDKLEGSDFPYFRDLALYERAAIYAELGKTDEASKTKDELRRLFPDSPYVEQIGDQDRQAQPAAEGKDEESDIK